MSPLEISTVDAVPVKDPQTEGCRIPGEIRLEEDGGVCPNPAASRSEVEGVGREVVVEEEEEEEEEEEDGYCTPTGPEHRIPKPLMCPPAPRKPIGRRCGRVRRKREFYGDHKVDSEEIELFFRQIISQLVAEGGPKNKKANTMEQKW